MSDQKRDIINHPSHYKGANGLETIDVIENFSLGFRLGNAVKYILRCGRKSQGGDIAVNLSAEAEDLKKARWYIDRELSAVEDSIEFWKRIAARMERENKRHSRNARRRKR